MTAVKTLGTTGEVDRQFSALPFPPETCHAPTIKHRKGAKIRTYPWFHSSIMGCRRDVPETGLGSSLEGDLAGVSVVNLTAGFSWL